MKRLTLLTILLVGVALVAGFAEEVKPTITISGSGSVFWGIDLMNYATGFDNTATASTTLTLAGAAGSKAGKDGWYGSISISAPSWVATDTGVLTFTAPATTATIVGMGGKAVIGVSTAPSLALDFVPAIEADSGAADALLEDEAEIGVTYAGEGTYLSYTMSDALMVGLEVVSENPWTTNVAQAYALALDVQSKFAGFTVNAGVNYGFNYAANPLGVGAKVAYTHAMITPLWVAFDGQILPTFAWEVGAGAGVTLANAMAASVAAFVDATNIDVMVSLTEPLAKGLVDKLEAGVTAYILDLTGVLEYRVAFTAGYDTGKLYPHVGVTYTDDSLLAATLTAFVHVDYDLFEAAPTTLFVEWNSDDLLASALGEFLVGVKVEY
jgi:hypothetical protein